MAISFQPDDDGWEGLSGFMAVARDTAGADRVIVAPRLDWSRITAADSILIFHPTRALDFDQVSAFLESGGRLALLDDQGRGAALLARFHVRRAPAPAHPETSLRENPELAIATPVEGNQARHPIVADVDQVVTNHPTIFRPAAGVDLTPVLEIRTEEGAGALIALTGAIGNGTRCTSPQRSGSDAASDRCGRLFALSDPSVFINLMLRYPGNRALAKGLLRYLTDSTAHKNGKLYVLINDFKQLGSVPSASARPNWLQRKLDELEDALEEIRAHGLSENAIRTLTVATAALLALVLFRMVLHSPPPQQPRYAEPVPFALLGGPVGRAAVLAANTTHPSLAVLELKSALEETLRQRLLLPPDAAPRVVLEACEQSGLLRPPSLIKLRQMLTEMTRTEAAVMRQRTVRIAPAQLERFRVQTLELLAILKSSERGKS
ncbi:MAG TPA: DUF4350 domain-containing protein [Polyangiaceae bacterium]|nr:DUF4350 domain-containing protein [Polyangiaceae bacterium]